MTGAKVLGLVVGFVVALAIGFFARPYVMSWRGADAAQPTTVQASAAQPAPALAHASAVTARERAEPVTTSLNDRLHPLMNKGTDMTIAAAGFRSGLQFAEVSHAAHNTGVPFVVLKDKVLRQHESLARAIHEMKPDVNATIEANRAVAEARSDLAATKGN